MCLIQSILAVTPGNPAGTGPERITMAPTRRRIMTPVTGRRIQLRRASLAGPLAHAGRKVIYLYLLCAFLCPGLNLARAETIALWLFDEPRGVHHGSWLKDEGPHRFILVLGRGAELDAGKFGHALRLLPTAPRPSPSLRGEIPLFGARLSTGGGQTRGGASVNATDSPLNLGAHDWTMECWLRLEPHARSEGTIFEIGSGSRGAGEVVTRFSVLPGEDAFALTYISSAEEGTDPVTRRIEYVNAEGPPFGVVFVRSATLAPGGARLPRDEWFHVAMVHAADAGDVRLFLNGRQRAVARVSMSALPRGEDACVSLGWDGQGQRPLPGALDELRISNHAAYAADFATPATFSTLHPGAGPAVTGTARRPPADAR